MANPENSATSTPDPEPISPNAEATDTQPTHTVKPPPKKRKPLSTDALDKLKAARVKAAEANRRKKQERQAAMQATYDPVVLVEQDFSDDEQLPREARHAHEKETGAGQANLQAESAVPYASRTCKAAEPNKRQGAS